MPQMLTDSEFNQVKEEALAWLAVLKAARIYQGTDSMPLARAAAGISILGHTARHAAVALGNRQMDERLKERAATIEARVLPKRLKAAK